MKLTQKARKFLRQWIKDLESGNFRQARCKLKDQRNKGYNYCCIGVAEVSAKKCDLVNDVTHNVSGDLLSVLAEEPDGYDIVKHFLNTKNPEISINNIDTNCISANDRYLCNFKQIAQGLRDKYNVRG